MSTDSTSPLHILLFPDQEIWVAQCLDFDIAAQGADIDSALDSLERVLIGQMLLDGRKGNEPLAQFKPAPQKYWNRFDKGTKIDKKRNFKLPGNPKPTSVDDLRIAA